MKSVDEQLALIRRGVEQIVPEDELRRKLERSVRTGKPLRIKYGIDPTGIDVHLGHTVPLRKLKVFQELGHQAVLIIGNYTALVGDPSGRDSTRQRLTPEKVEENARDYLKQVSKVIDIERTEVTRNGDWFGKFSFLDVLKLTSTMTVQRMLERDDFTKRFRTRVVEVPPVFVVTPGENQRAVIVVSSVIQVPPVTVALPDQEDFTKRFRAELSMPIYLHECLYPLMQGHDSVEIKADLELGGSEQLFNLMVGRKLQEEAGQEPQICLTLPILRGLDGERRMGKSLGNYIGVGEPAQVQFDKTMSIPDALMREWFELLTDRTAEDIRG